MTVLVNSDLPPDQQSQENFTYGVELGGQYIRTSIRDYLRRKYEDDPGVVLDIEGQEFDI